MYNTNKVSPPAFIPNQFLVKEPNPEGLQAGGAGRGDVHRGGIWLQDALQ